MQVYSAGSLPCELFLVLLHYVTYEIMPVFVGVSGYNFCGYICDL